MATFIALLNFTDKGIKNVKESPDRYDNLRKYAEKLGVAFKDVYWTVGQYDMVVVLEGADKAVTTVLLTFGSLGYVRSQTLRGFSAEEMKDIVSNMP